MSTPPSLHPASSTPPPPPLSMTDSKVELSGSVTVIPPTPPAHVPPPTAHVPPPHKPGSPSDTSINMHGSMSRPGRLTASAMINYDKKKKQAEMGKNVSHMNGGCSARISNDPVFKSYVSYASSFYFL